MPQVRHYLSFGLASHEIHRPPSKENGRCHMAGNRSDSLSLEPVVTLKDFTDILLCQSFSNQNTANGFSKVHLAEYHNIAFLSRLFYRVERNRFFHNT